MGSDRKKNGFKGFFDALFPRPGVLWDPSEKLEMEPGEA
jgi:hypothetical protein